MMKDQSSKDLSGDFVSREEYNRLQTRYERLMEISRQLNSTLDLGALLRQIIDAATELTDTEEASILLIDPSSGELRFEATSNLSRAEMEAIPVPMDGSLAGWVATHGESVLVTDAQSDSRWFSRVDKTTKFSTRNLLAVPMNLQRKAIGVLEAINKRGGQPWATDDRDILAALADQAAIAVQNARLFQQSDFIAEMVHELRTPLAALKASTALLLRPSLSPALREDIVRTMQQETERLADLTTDFLDLARLESGRTRLEVEPFDIMALIRECITIVENRASERNLKIETQGPAYWVSADRNKIKQVLLNLLTNAIKYNVDGGSIWCAVEPFPHDPNKVQVRIQDTGIGISQADQENIFNKFFRAPSTPPDVPGTGLGLAIAKRIVEAHGCDMWFESEPHVGTTFYFTMPANAGQASTLSHLPGSAEFLGPNSDTL